MDDEDNTIQEVLENDPSIIAMYPTMKVQQGKWFIFIRTENEVLAKEKLDETLPKLVKIVQKSGTTDNSAEIKVPQRNNLMPHSQSIMTYAQALAKSTQQLAKQYTRPPKTTKRQIQLSYDENSEFPPEAKKDQTWQEHHA